MTFDYRKFILTGLKGSIGVLPDFQVIYRASGYYEKGILKIEDLQEIQDYIDAKNGIVKEYPVTDESEAEGEEE